MKLLFASIPFIGHLNPLLQQARELQRRGHAVRVAAFSDLHPHVAAEAPELVRVDLGPLGAAAETLRRAQRDASRDRSFVRGTARLLAGLVAAWEPTFDGVARELEREPAEGLVVDLFASAAMAAADHARVPFVVNNPDLLAALSVKLLPPADHLPALFSGRRRCEVGAWQRLTAPLFRRLAAALASATVGRELNALRARRGLAPVDLHNYLRGRTILVDSAFGLEYPRPLPPGVHLVGPMLPASPPRLPAEWERWLADGPPVVYANLGTLAVLPDPTRQALEAAFADLPARVLWIRREPWPKPLGRVRVETWGPPPLALLSHPNVRACVAHGGLNGVHEALAAGVPLVVMPILADQRDMAARVVDAGVGLAIDKRGLQPETLRDAIRRVVEDARFRAAVPPVQAALAAAGGVSRAADLIEAALCEEGEGARR